MSHQVIGSDSLVELSTEEQQLLSGGHKHWEKQKRYDVYHYHQHHHVHEFRYPKNDDEDKCYDKKDSEY